MNYKKMNRRNWIIPIVWGILFCLNMAFYLVSGGRFTLFIAGVMLGGTIIGLMAMKRLNFQNKLISEIIDLTEVLHKQTKRLLLLQLKDAISSKKRKRKSGKKK